MVIHSSFGVLECEPMTLQAIEKSIPEATGEEQNQLSECDLVEDEPCSNGLITRINESDECPF